MSSEAEPSTRPVLPGSQAIELVRPAAPVGRVHHALFDFDGTVSLIRAGWQEVMIPMMVDHLAACPAAEPREALLEVVREFVEALTGKQTIYQMLRLAEEVGHRGGQPADPLAYKHEYLGLLWERIKHRVEGLRDGSVAPEALLVRGVRATLEALRERGVVCYLASGTDLPFVESEAAALGVAELFDGGIHGALDDYRRFSKAQVIDRILADHGLAGPELVSFGDGYVEIENAVAVGGLAVGIASDETGQPGRLDEWKRNRLIGAGAHLVAPDFAEHATLLAWLFGEEG